MLTRLLKALGFPVKQKSKLTRDDVQVIRTKIIDSLQADNYYWSERALKAERELKALQSQVGSGMMTYDDAMQELQNAVDRVGSIDEFASLHAFKRDYIALVLDRRVPATVSLLQTIGISRGVHYRRDEDVQVSTTGNVIDYERQAA